MTGSHIRSWISKGQPRSTWPDWLEAAIVGRVEANGTFMIHTKRGDARVHPGNMIFDRKGDVYTCAPGEARTIIAELDELDVGAAKLNPTARGGPPPQRQEADVADRADDTDDIGRRIREGVTVADDRAPPKIAPPTVAAMTKSTSQKPPAAALPMALRSIQKPRGGWSAAKGRPPSIEMRHPAELLIDDSYQRSIDTGPSRALIARIAAGWDWRMCLPLVVSRRDDGFFVIDGQHRHAAALLRDDIQFLPCCIATYTDVAEEAAMFVAMNRQRRAMNRLDDFHAAQAGGNDEAVAVAAMIEEVGFTVSRRTGSAAWAPGEVAFTAAIAKVRRRYGAAAARDALALMAKVFVGQRLVAGSSVFSALASVLGSPPENFDVALLEAALRTFDMPGWASFLNESKGGSDRHKHLRDMLLEAYADMAKLEAGE